MSARPQETPPSISFTLNGRSIDALPGETILQAAKRHGVAIPHLCHSDSLRPDGNCRACMVEIDGKRVLAPSCCRIPSKGANIASDSVRARSAQRLVLELLRSDVSAENEYTPDDELTQWCDHLDVGRPRFPMRKQPAADHSHPAIAVNLDACVQCTRCLRACRETQANDVIGYAGRGSHARIVFDLEDPMGQSSCVACGECVQACPTGALMPAGGVGMLQPERQVDSVCPYCGVGCQLTYHVAENRILRVEGRDGPANHGRLCVKGRYGFDYISHRHRLLRPSAATTHRSGRTWTSTTTTRCVISVRPAGTRRCSGQPADSASCAIGMGLHRWPALARPKGRTRRRTCSRNWSVPVSAATMSITARACATPLRLPHCCRWLVRALSPTRLPMSVRPT